MLEYLLRTPHQCKGILSKFVLFIMINAVRKSDIVFNESYRLNKRDVEIYVPLGNLKILAFGPPGL